MKEHMRYKADTTPPRNRTQNKTLCFLISISAVILKLMLKITSISPRDLGESLRRKRRSAFINHTLIHTHNLLHYYKVGDQARSKLKETDQLVEDFIQTRETATLGQGEFGEFTLVQSSKIQLNQLWYSLGPVQTSNFTCAELNARVKCM